MFYTKAQIDPNTAIVTEITEENVFTLCPDCGEELAINLNDVVGDNGLLDLFSTGVCCAECSKKRWKEAHRR